MNRNFICEEKNHVQNYCKSDLRSYEASKAVAKKARNCCYFLLSKLNIYCTIKFSRQLHEKSLLQYHYKITSTTETDNVKRLRYLRQCRQVIFSWKGALITKGPKNRTRRITVIRRWVWVKMCGFITRDQLNTLCTFSQFMSAHLNRRFPSCILPLFQSQSQCEAFLMEIIVLFTRKVWFTYM